MSIVYGRTVEVQVLVLVPVPCVTAARNACSCTVPGTVPCTTVIGFVSHVCYIVD
jgi:hypothetical protein